MRFRKSRSLNVDPIEYFLSVAERDPVELLKFLIEYGAISPRKTILLDKVLLRNSFKYRQIKYATAFKTFTEFLGVMIHDLGGAPKDEHLQISMRHYSLDPNKEEGVPSLLFFGEADSRFLKDLYAKIRKFNDLSKQSSDANFCPYWPFLGDDRICIAEPETVRVFVHTHENWPILPLAELLWSGENPPKEMINWLNVFREEQIRSGHNLQY